MRNSRASGVRIINLTCNGSNKKYVDIIFRGWGSLWQKVESRQFDKVIDSLTITNARLFPQSVCRKISIAKAGAGSSYTELFKMYIALIHKCILSLLIQLLIGRQIFWIFHQRCNIGFLNLMSSLSKPLVHWLPTWPFQLEENALKGKIKLPSLAFIFPHHDWMMWWFYFLNL